MITPLLAQERSCESKGQLQKRRMEGWTPAIIYGDKKNPKEAYIKTKEFLMEVHKEGARSRIFTIDDEKVLIKSICFKPTKDIPLHIDFIRLGQRVTILVPLRFINEDKCPGLKRGGVLNIIHHELKLSVSSHHIPQEISIDLENVLLGQTIHLNEISLPQDSKVLSVKQNESLISIVSPAGAKDDSKAE